MHGFLQQFWIALGFQPVFLWSDILIYVLLVGGGFWLGLALRREYWRIALRQVASNRMAMICWGILCLYAAVGFLDTLHFRAASPENAAGGNIQSVLDLLCIPLVERTEKTYSAPFGTHLYSKETILTPDGRKLRAYPRLKHAGSRLPDPNDRWPDIRKRLLVGLGWGLGIDAMLLFLFVGLTALIRRRSIFNDPTGPPL